MSEVKLYLSKRSNGFYYILIKHSDGRREWKTTKCHKKPEAYQFLQSFEHSLNEAKRPRVPSFSEFLKIYDSIQSSVIRKSTMGLYQILAKKFVELNSDRPLNEYTSLEFEQSRAKQIGEGISVTRMNMYTRAIKTMFNFALKQNIIQSNPFAYVKQIKQPKKAPAFFTYNDLLKVTALCSNQQLNAIFTVAFFTGMRMSELLNLKWSQIDFEKNQIKVSNTDEFTTKSGRERVIPIHSKVKELLSGMNHKNEYVFAKEGNYRYSRCYVTHRFKKFSRKAGLPENIKFHSTRHSFASLCVQSGVDIYSVQHLLGHSDVSTTQIYSHLTENHLQGAMERVKV